MKILLIADSIRHMNGGTEGQLLKLIEGLQSEGVVVELSILRKTSFAIEKEFICPVNVLEIKKIISLRSVLSILWHLWSKRMQGFKLVQTFFIDSSVLVPVLASLLRMRVLISRRDMGYWYNPKLLRALRINRSMISGAIVNSKAIKECVHNNELIHLEKIHVIYNAIDSDCVDFPERTLDPAKFKIGYMANYRKLKRVEDLIEAFSKLIQKYPAAELHLVGADLEEKLGGIVKERELQDKIIFYGQVANPMKVLTGVDIGVLCSESEGLSNAIIEFLASGKPVIATRVGGNVELVFDGKTGFLVDVGDVEGLANAMYRLAMDADAVTNMGERARAFVKSNFAVKKMVQQHLAIYKTVLGS